jgi:acylphosphatase
MKKTEGYITVRLRVRGMVQGVGFRYWTLARACERSLGGYARNLPDRSVEVELSGPAEAVEAMIELISSGPRHAVVESMDVLERKRTADPVREFRIVP